MDDFLILLALVGMIVGIWGLIRGRVPSLRIASRWQAGAVFVGSFLIGMIGAALGGQEPSSSDVRSAFEEGRKAGLEAAAGKKSDGVSTAKTGTVEQAKENTKDQELEKTKTTDVKWNTRDNDPFSNGNIQVAAKLIKAGGATANAKNANVGEIAKAPWKHYGTPYKFAGVIADLQEYPPGSDVSSMVGAGQDEVVSEVVIVDPNDESATPVYALVLGETGDVKVGDSVSVTCLVTGVAQVPNKIGGFFNHLVVVCDAIQKASG